MITAAYRAFSQNQERRIRKILAFSISHNHEIVRIYGHYPVIDGNETTFCRHPIRKFDFAELKGREKWPAYRFTECVYLVVGINIRTPSNNSSTFEPVNTANIALPLACFLAEAEAITGISGVCLFISTTK
jgi:hypothetical protein